MGMDENSIATHIVDCSFKIHKTLGPGLLESVYQNILAYELRKRGFHVDTEVDQAISYEGIQFDVGFKLDLVVENLVVVELKSVEEIHPVHQKQLLTYLKLSGKRLGLLINFNDVLIKDDITRIANGM